MPTYRLKSARVGPIKWQLSCPPSGKVLKPRNDRPFSFPTFDLPIGKSSAFWWFDLVVYEWSFFYAEKTVIELCLSVILILTWWKKEDSPTKQKPSLSTVTHTKRTSRARKTWLNYCLAGHEWRASLSKWQQRRLPSVNSLILGSPGCVIELLRARHGWPCGLRGSQFHFTIAKVLILDRERRWKMLGVLWGVTVADLTALELMIQSQTFSPLADISCWVPLIPWSIQKRPTYVLGLARLILSRAL